MESNKPKFVSPTAHLLLAVLIIILGVGNVLVGKYRHDVFVQARELSTSSAETSADENFPLPLEPDLNQRAKRIRKIDHRLKFYGLVVNGGIVLVVGGSLYLLATIVLLELKKNKNKSKA
jgi:hypothetical protein